MSRASVAKVAARVRAEAMAKVVVVALVDGRTVVSHHADFVEGNVALCAALDAFCDVPANENVAHSFDLIPLNRAVPVGSAYHPSEKVFIP